MIELFVDVTAIYFHSNRSGIPRVITTLSEHLARIDGVRVQWFVYHDGRFFRVPRGGHDKPGSLARSKGRLRSIIQKPLVAAPILRAVAQRIWSALCGMRLAAGAFSGATPLIPGFSSVDTVLLIEGHADLSYYAAMRRKRGGATVVAIICDIFALRYPQFYPPGTAEQFAYEFSCRAELADILVGVSHETVRSLAQYLGERGVAKHVRQFYLGSDVLNDAARPDRGRAPRRQILSVNSIEPRKNHVFALALCTRLWLGGFDFDYVIVGAAGWMSQGFIASLERHDEFGRRLIYRGSIDDSDLAELYATSDVFLSTSLDEGFGLTVQEALHHGLPVICSDIPIFRELCGDQANFIPLDDLEAATRTVGAMLEQGVLRATCPARAPGLVSWQDSAKALHREIMHLRSTDA